MSVIHLTFPTRPVDRHTETVATSAYLNQRLRTEAEVISLRAARQAADRPCDTEGGSAA